MSFNEKENFLDNKGNIKNLLEEIARKVKSKEEINGVNTELDDKLLELSSQIDKATTEEEMKDILNEIKTEILAKKEYKKYKDILNKLESELDRYRHRVKEKTQDELAKLAQKIYKSRKKRKYTPEELVKLANSGRKKAVERVKKVIGEIKQNENSWLASLVDKAENAEGFFG